MILLPSFTGLTEKLGILATRPCQFVHILSTGDANDFTTEKIEISLVDFNTGKETILVRKDFLKNYAEVVAQALEPRTKGEGMIEVSDGKNLDLNGNTVLRVNLFDLIAAKTYFVFGIDDLGISGGTPVSYEQLIIPQGVTTQRFPTPDGSFLMLPITNLLDIRVRFTDNTETRADSVELQAKARAKNGIILFNTDLTIAKVGCDNIILQPLKVQVENGPSKVVSEVEINLTAGNGYTIYKAIHLDKPGYDSRY